MEIKPIIQLMTMCSVFIPILASIWVWGKLEKALKYLGLFLFWGFLNDLKQHIPITELIRPYMIGIYALSEVLFFTWLIRYLSPQLKVWKYYQGVIAGIISIWLFSYSPVYFLHYKNPQNSLFDTLTTIYLSFISAFALLQLTKRSIQLVRQYQFWILTGIYIYFTCSILIFSFLPFWFHQEIWFLQGFFDLLKMILFTFGFTIAARGIYSSLRHT